MNAILELPWSLLLILSVLKRKFTIQRHRVSSPCQRYACRISFPVRITHSLSILRYEQVRNIDKISCCFTEKIFHLLPENFGSFWNFGWSLNSSRNITSLCWPFAVFTRVLECEKCFRNSGFQRGKRLI